MSKVLFTSPCFVTVVIPTFNRVSLLQQAIASVLAQTYGNWELIVVDDESTDGTVEMIRSMHDPRIRVLELSHSGNIAAIRNAGVQEGSGYWVAFLDSDDVWVPQKLEIQLNQLQQEKKRWGYGGFELMNEEGQTIPNKSVTYVPLSGWIIREQLTCEASVNLGTLMVERSLFNEVGGFNTSTNLICREDYEFALRLTLKAETTATPALLVRVREHKDRTTNALGDGHERTAYVYQHFINTRPGKALERIAKRQRAFNLAEASVKSMRGGKHLVAARQFGKAIVGGDSWRHLFSSLYRAFFVRQTDPN